MSNALGHVAVDVYLERNRRGGNPSDPSGSEGAGWGRMDEERRAYLEQQRLLQRNEGKKATGVDHARGFSVAQHNRRK